MSQLTREAIYEALTRLAELAVAHNITIRLLLVGGAVMTLQYRLRNSTRDIDAVVLEPDDHDVVRKLAAKVAAEREWREDWLNEGAKGFLHGPLSAQEFHSMPGLQLLTPSLEQLLAMKLSAWRDDLDISDAAALLEMGHGSPDRANGVEQVDLERLDPVLGRRFEQRAARGAADVRHQQVGPAQRRRRLVHEPLDLAGRTAVARTVALGQGRTGQLGGHKARGPPLTNRRPAGPR